MRKNSFAIFSLLSIYLLWIAAVLDPIGSLFGLRYVALILIGITLLLQILTRKLRFRIRSVYSFLFFYLVLILPTYGVLIYFFRGAVVEADFIDTSYIAAGVLFGCSLAYLNPDTLRIGLAAQNFALRMLAFTIIICVLTYELGLPTFILGYFVENGVAFFGPFRNYGGVSFYYMYFIASPMLIYLGTQEVWRLFDKKTSRQFLWCGVALVALFLSGTRANIFLAILIVPFVYAWKRFGLLAVPVIGFVAAAFLIIASFLEVQSIAAMLDPQNESIEVKLGFLSGYADIFSKIDVLLFGQGFNAHTWSDTFADMLPDGEFGGASKTELTYIEILRVFGVIVGGTFFCLIAVLLRKISAMDSSFGWMAPAIFLYLIGSTLNPYLFSSNGMLPLGLCAAALHGYVLNSLALNDKAPPVQDDKISFTRLGPKNVY